MGRPMKAARNVAIILLIAAPVAFIPAGSVAAAVTQRVLFILFAVVMVLFAGRFYLEHRTDIFGLGDRDRLLAYSALGAIVLALAGRPMWIRSGAGTVAFVALLTFAVLALIGVFQRWRAY
jgi:hypothetical protein